METGEERYFAQSITQMVCLFPCAKVWISRQWSMGYISVSTMPKPHIAHGHVDQPK